VSDVLYTCKHNLDGSIIVTYATGRGCPLCALEEETDTRSTKMDAICANRFYANEEVDREQRQEAGL
jgi:hypothetical protein